MRALLCLALAASLAQDPTTLAGHTRQVWSVAVSPDGKLLASGSTDATIRIWDLSTKQMTAELKPDNGDVFALAFSPDGKLLASGDQYKKVKVWDLASKSVKKELAGIDGPVRSLVFSPDGSTIFVGSIDNAVRVWRHDRDAEPAKLGHDYEVYGVALSKDGKWLASVDGSGEVRVWDSSGKPAKTLKHADKAACVAFSPDGKTMATGGGDHVKLWDTSSWAEKAAAKFDANAAAFSPDGTRLVIGTQDNLVVFLDGATLDVKARHERHEAPVTAVAISPDGKWAYTGSQDYTVKVWPVT